LIVSPYAASPYNSSAAWVRFSARPTPTLKRTVAIKVLPQAVATNGERLARFQREAEVLARLNHPNIASFAALPERRCRQEADFAQRRHATAVGAER
jgi:serine/threonine protein kinase